jgi:hypothetical protein
MSSSERYITKYGQPKEVMHSKTHHDRQNGHQVIFTNLYQSRPCFQIVEPKGLSVNVKFYKGKTLHKFKKHLKKKPTTSKSAIV